MYIVVNRNPSLFGSLNSVEYIGGCFTLSFAMAAVLLVAMAAVLCHSCCSVVALCYVGCWLLWLLVGGILVWALAGILVGILVVICCWWHFVLVAFYLAAYNSMDSTAAGSIHQLQLLVRGCYLLAAYS
ncbi:hypothetical protein ACSBR2_013877 [Camellia fascicularis]